MAAPIHRRIARWIIDHLLWDTSGTVREGFWGGLWAARKLLVAVAGAALLTWREWVEHHPPEIVLVGTPVVLCARDSGAGCGRHGNCWSLLRERLCCPGGNGRSTILPKYGLGPRVAS